MGSEESDFEIPNGSICGSSKEEGEEKFRSHNKLI